jgi:anhydro-N-acetylmuramic acid kinase
MSGTSLDGIDIICASFTFDHRWQFEIYCAETIPYSASWRSKLGRLVDLGPGQLKEIDREYTGLLCKVINEFIIRQESGMLDAVCSHGHTALHRPQEGLTFQIGNLPELAKGLKQVLICDFRVQDVALGGQGAPLVPIGDQLLFPDYEYCLNLGGFANLSTMHENKRIAFDICPVNIVMNHYAAQAGLDYDNKGQMASKGQIHEPLLDQLDALDFYERPYPKSLGFEWVKNRVFPVIDKYELEVNDVLRTFAEHVAGQISKVVATTRGDNVLITGGGAFNSFLIERLQSKIVGTMVIPSKEIIEYKEALVFGLLGVLRLRNEVNCLQSVTGASRDHCSGKIFRP